MGKELIGVDWAEDTYQTFSWRCLRITAPHCEVRGDVNM